MTRLALIVLMAFPALGAPLGNATVRTRLQTFATDHVAGVTLAPTSGVLTANGTNLSYEGDGDRVSVGLSKSVWRGADGDALAPFVQYVTVDELNTGVRLRGWSVSVLTPQSSKRDGIELVTTEAGTTRVQFDWQVYALVAYKQSRPCIEAMGIADGGLPAGCVEQVELNVPLHVAIDLPVAFASDTPKRVVRAFEDHVTEGTVEPVACGGRCWGRRMVSDDAGVTVVGGVLAGRSSEGLLVRVPAKGDGWQKRFSQATDLASIAAVEGGAIVGGTYIDRVDLPMGGYTSSEYGVVLRVDEAGEVLWSRRFEENRVDGRVTDEVHDVRLLPGGDVLAVGSRVRRLDAETGETVWDRALADASDFGVQSALFPNGDVAIVGTCQRGLGDARSHGIVDFLVTRLDDTGAPQWTRCLGGGRIDEGQSIAVMADGNLVVAGGTGSTDGDVEGMRGENNIWAVELDGDGAMVWQACLGSSRVADHSPMRVVAAVLETEGGVRIAGTNRGEDIDVEVRGGTDGLIVQLDRTGRTVWQQSIGTPHYDGIVDVTTVDVEMVTLMTRGESRGLTVTRLR
jgi:hypothetical protein